MSRYGKYDLRLYKFLMPSVKLSVEPCGLIGVCNCSSIVEVLSTVTVDLGDSSSGRSVSFSTWPLLLKHRLPAASHVPMFFTVLLFYCQLSTVVAFLGHNCDHL